MRSHALILRFVESKESLTTTTVKVVLPAKLQRAFVPLLRKVCELFSEHRGDHAKDLQGPEPENPLEILQIVLNEDYRHEEMLQALLQGPLSEHKPLLNLAAEAAIYLTRGMRRSLWQFLEEFPGVIAVDNLRKLAGEGSILRCRGGFSLLAADPASESINPLFGIRFDTHRERARSLFRYTQGSTFLCSNRRFSLSLQTKQQEIIQKEVDFKIQRREDRCWEEYQEVMEEAPDVRVIYHEISVNFSEEHASKVSLKLFHTQKRMVSG